MSLELIFIAMTALSVLIWLVWILAPSSSWAVRLSREPIVWFGYGLIYAALLLAAALEGLPAGSGFTSLEAVMRLFDSEWALLAGWAHYIAFDLFVGGWMMRDAPSARHRLAIPLVLTMLVGPIGLAIYLARRSWFQRDRVARLPD